MKLHDYRSYRKYLLDWIAAQPGGGHGQRQKIAAHLGIQSSMLSQVFGGSKELSLEQACKLCGYFGFDEDETAYFLDLVQLERSGTPQLKQHFTQRLERSAKSQSKISHISKKHRELTDVEKSIYYSTWQYAAVRLLTEITRFQDPGAIAERLSLPPAAVHQILKFLVKAGLVVEQGERYKSTGAFLFGGKNNPWAAQNRRNWRLKTMERFDRLEEHEFAFTHVIALSEQAAHEVRAILKKAAEEINVLAEKSKSEKVACLNIDWVDL